MYSALCIHNNKLLARSQNLEPHRLNTTKYWIQKDLEYKLLLYYSVEPNNILQQLQK